MLLDCCWLFAGIVNTVTKQHVLSHLFIHQFDRYQEMDLRGKGGCRSKAIYKLVERTFYLFLPIKVLKKCKDIVSMPYWKMVYGASHKTY